MTGFIIREFRRLPHPPFCGFAQVELPGGLIILDVPVFQGPRGPWASLPRHPAVSRSGLVIRDDAGRTKFEPSIDFVSRDAKHRWVNQVVVAMWATHPEAFG
jgi:hypothetical protein